MSRTKEQDTKIAAIIHTAAATAAASAGRVEFYSNGFSWQVMNGSFMNLRAEIGRGSFWGRQSFYRSFVKNRS